VKLGSRLSKPLEYPLTGTVHLLAVMCPFHHRKTTCQIFAGKSVFDRFLATPERLQHAILRQPSIKLLEAFPDDGVQKRRAGVSHCLRPLSANAPHFKPLYQEIPVTMEQTTESFNAWEPGNRTLQLSPPSPAWPNAPIRPRDIEKVVTLHHNATHRLVRSQTAKEQ